MLSQENLEFDRTKLENHFSNNPVALLFVDCNRSKHQIVLSNPLAFTSFGSKCDLTNEKAPSLPAFASIWANAVVIEREVRYSSKRVRATADPIFQLTAIKMKTVAEPYRKATVKGEALLVSYSKNVSNLSWCTYLWITNSL